MIDNNKLEDFVNQVWESSIIPELVEVVDFKKGPYYAEVGDFSSAGSSHLRLSDELPVSCIA